MFRVDRSAAPDSGPVVTTSGQTADYGGADLFDADLLMPRGSVHGRPDERRGQDHIATSVNTRITARCPLLRVLE